MTAYDAFRVRCAETASIFDRAAEKARSRDDMTKARACSEQAIRLRYLAERDPDVAELFDLSAAQALASH